MKQTTDHFVYKRRFNNSFKDLFNKRISYIKSRLQHILASNKFTLKYLDPFERFAVSRKRWIDKYSFTDAFNLPKINPVIYDNIKLTKVSYFEAIEIDSFNKFRRNAITKFSNNQTFFSTKSKDDLKQKLSEVKEDLDTISWGNLFSLNISKNKTQHNDLISFINVAYIKTNESFFILKFEVTPSEKFEKIFEKIIIAEPIGLTVPHYNSFINILKTRRFNSFDTFRTSLKCDNINNLLADLNHQIKQTLTKHLKGYFHNSKMSYLLPSIEYFEVQNIDQFHQDKDLSYNFDGGLNGFYTLEDNEIEIYISSRNSEDQTNIKVIKQKGHGKRNSTEKDLTDWDNIETHYLIDSLSFPCVFQGILKEQFNKLNSLKRSIYDFVFDTSKPKIFKFLFLFHYNNRYVKLKQELTQILLTTKRFENEFTKDNIYLYTRHFELQKFKHQTRFSNNDNKNLLQFIINNFTYQLKELDKKTKSINEIFKTIEELNSYRTNFVLQITSLFVAILAFVFAFDKAKSLVVAIYKYFFHK